MAALLEFNEAATRARIIDSLLATSGWNVALGDASTTEVGKEIEVQHQPSASGLGHPLREGAITPKVLLNCEFTSRPRAALPPDKRNSGGGERAAETSTGRRCWPALSSVAGFEFRSGWI
jgi:hypothetical protein